MKLKKGTYYSRDEFVKYVCIIVLGNYLYDGTTKVPFSQVAAFLNISPDLLYMKKKVPEVIAMFEDEGIKVKKIKGINHFSVEEFHLAIEEDNTLNI